MSESEPVPFEYVRLELWHPCHRSLGTYAGPGAEMKANEALRDLASHVPVGKIWRAYVKVVTQERDEYELLMAVGCAHAGRGLRVQLIHVLEGFVDDAVLQAKHGATPDDVAAMIRSLTGTPDQVSRGEALAKHLGDQDCALRGACQEGRAEYNAELLLLLRLGYTPTAAVDEARRAIEGEVQAQAWCATDQQLLMGIHAAWRDAHAFLDQFQDVTS
jgi:hypothetical protein